MKVQSTWMKLCLVGAVFFGAGRIGSAVCTRDCRDIEGKLFRADSGATKCWVFGYPRDEGEPPTIELQCSKASAFPVWVQSGWDVECISVGFNISIYNCDLAACDDVCPTKSPPKEIDYNDDTDPMMAGEQVNLEKCTLVTPSWTYKECGATPEP